MTAIGGQPEVDVLAFAAHPDDVELACGGTMIRFADAGRRLVVVDMTRGERGSLGTPGDRASEAQRATELLGLVARETWEFPDTELVASIEVRKAVVTAIRRYRPAVVLAPAPNDLHPDHAAAGRAIREAVYPAGMRNFDVAGKPFRPSHVLHYFLHDVDNATVVVDVTDVWPRRLQLARCFTSQIQQPVRNGFPTLLSRPDFLAGVEARARVWGRRVGFELGEPLQAMSGVIGVRDVHRLFGSDRCVSE